MTEIAHFAELNKAHCFVDNWVVAADPAELSRVLQVVGTQVVAAKLAELSKDRQAVGNSVFAAKHVDFGSLLDPRRSTMVVVEAAKHRRSFYPRRWMDGAMNWIEIAQVYSDTCYSS